MMKGKTGLAWKLLFSMILAALICTPMTVSAEDAAVVLVYKVAGDNTELRLNPPDLYVKKNTVVIWMNSVMGEEVQVVFRDGKACQDISFSPEAAFNLDAKSCFVTSFLPYAATSSLKFMETGEFDYVVQNLSEKITGKGKIIVRDM